MTAILAEFTSATLPSVLASVNHNYLLVNIFAVAVITAAGLACAVALRKPGDRPGV
jgi:hypothetical protein